MPTKFAYERDGLRIRVNGLEEERENLKNEIGKKAEAISEHKEQEEPDRTERDGAKEQLPDVSQRITEYEEKYQKAEREKEKFKDELDDIKKKSNKRHWVETLRSLVSAHDATISNWKPYVTVSVSGLYAYYWYVCVNSNDDPYWCGNSENAKTEKEVWNWVSKYASL